MLNVWIVDGCLIINDFQTFIEYFSTLQNLFLAPVVVKDSNLPAQPARNLFLAPVVVEDSNLPAQPARNSLSTSSVLRRN